MKTLGAWIDHVINIHDQVRANAEKFSTTTPNKRREAHINGRVKELQDDYADAKTQHIKILAAKDENGIKETYLTNEVFIGLKETYLDYLGELHAALEEQNKADNKITAPEKQDKAIDIRLKRIDIPAFEGGYDQWRPFFELYTSLVHSNDTLADIQKLHYLKASVQGEAARLLQHVSLEEKNYDSAWKILVDRYENKRVLVNTHLRILLQQKPLIVETASGIKEILDTTTECVHSLRNLGVPVDTWDVILIYLLTAKLPTNTQEGWEEQLQGAKNLSELTAFTQFLETRFRTLESIEQSRLELRKSTKQSATAPSKPFFKCTKNFYTGFPNDQQGTSYPQTINCRLCKGDHCLRTCEKFRSMNPNLRLENVKRLGACLNCLSFRHTKLHCKSSYRCRECNQRHHTMLHSPSQQQTIQQPQNKKNFNNRSNAQHLVLKQQSQHQNMQRTQQTDTASQQENSDQRRIMQMPNHQVVQSLFTQQMKPVKTLLATALVNCHGTSGEIFTFRALIDPGSEATFITEAAVQKLRLPKRKTTTNIISLGQSTTGIAYNKTSLTITSTHNSKFNLTLEAYVYTNITSILPSEKFEIRHWKHLMGLQLADPIYNTPGKIDILLGADVYAAIILSGLRKGPPGAPIAQNSELGWIISGKVQGLNSKTIHTYHQMINLDTQLRRFWEIEEIPEQRTLTEEEKICEEHYMQTHIRLPDGRYQVRLPFKGQTKPSFDNSKQAAISRFYHLERRFQVNPKLKDMYTECLNDYVSSSHMIEMESPTHEESYYLPHHAVFKDSSTTKLRVVFDASCKAKNGQSLNDCLLVGPTLQNDLSNIIAKWRKFKIAYTADITKMYRQIWIDPRDSNYQLICWRDNINSEIKTYALKTVTFGTASAPFLAVRTLQQLALDEQNKYPLASKILKDHFYVDDVMCGADSIEAALQAQDQLIKITNSAGFPLRKWASNRESLLENICPENREIDIPLTFGNENYVKTLGFQWHPKLDTFKFNFKFPEFSKVTKRGILSDISRLFDPHGWISPCIIHAKLIIQELWIQQANWDDPVPKSLHAQWLKYRDELHTLETIEIPRWIQTTAATQNIQIHGFCDASEKAYAAVVYIRLKTKTSIHVQLLMAKTKIAPLKRISLPRLELCAAVLLAKLLQSIKQTMDFHTAETFAWTDSMIALAWIKANPSKWKAFVANRVTEIQANTSTNIWRHVGTKENPADIASRGLFPSEIHHADTWWHGPNFLRQMTLNYHSNAVPLATNLEIRNIKSLQIKTTESIIIEIIERYSTLHKAMRVLAYFIRATHNFKQPKQRISGPLTVNELEIGLQEGIKAIQKATFYEERSNIINKNTVARQSNLITLHPFLDNNEILRVGGRLQNADLPFNRQHPIILPQSNHLTNLIIHDAHLKTAHGGITLTTEYIQNQYWIVNAKRNIKTILKKCITCFRFKAAETNQLMGNLPSARVQIARPFCNTGVDYAGPIEIKAWKGRCNKVYKGYIAIFVCLCTKAIHIELVSDLSTAAFIAAFRRFTARRGICKNLYSDNGTNFVGACNKMTAEMKTTQRQWKTEISNILISLGTQWHFIPPAAPHFGGLWEAGVKSIKYHLKRIISNARLTFEEYGTLLSQIEACLNSRPLCPKSPDPDDLSTITPGHFLVMSSLHTTPEQDRISTNIGSLDRWNLVQKLYQTFWDKWSSEYLSRLQQRPKWNTPQSNIKVGDLILLKESRMPPTHWQLARVMDTHPGKDNLTRVVTVKTATSTVQRPITKVCLLPISDNNDDQQHKS